MIVCLLLLARHALQMQAKANLKFPRSEVVFEAQRTMPQKEQVIVGYLPSLYEVKAAKWRLDLLHMYENVN